MARLWRGALPDMAGEAEAEAVVARRGSGDAERAAFDALCALVGDVESDVLERVPPGQATTVVALARLHGVEAWLATVAPRIPAWGVLGEQRRRFHAARMRADAVIADLTDILGGLQCAWVVLKGPALACSVYPRPELRHGVDLDVLVPPSRYGEVLDALVDEAGFELLERNWPLIDTWLPGELKLRSPRGVLVDLHWSLIAEADARASLRLSTTGLLSRARMLDAGVPALDEGDQLLHVAMHAAMSGGNRLSWLLDLDLSARRRVDWDDLVRSASACRGARMAGVVLERARTVLGAPVPPAVLEELSGGPAQRRLNRTVDRLSPVGPDPERPSLARSWARSVRESGLATAVEFARHVGGWARSGMSRTRPPSEFVDPTDPRSALYRVDDTAARARYLARVAESE